MPADQLDRHEMPSILDAHQAIAAMSHHDHAPDAPCGFQAQIDGLRHALNGVLRGKQATTEKVLACLLARGHLLIEDLPGLGKTTLAKAIASSIGGEFARIQCTPDLLPSDITGFSLLNPKTREFEFRAGPVFASVLLADELNRATPRTQSALFEAMAERQVTLDRTTHPLQETFFVIATQNAVDTHGVFPLPDAQLDRFTMRLSLGYPSAEDETEMLADAIGTHTDRRRLPNAVIDLAQIMKLQEHVATVEVSAPVRRYLVDVAHASRRRPDVASGVSPRGLLVWQSVCQAWAHLDGRDFVTPQDAQQTAHDVLGVRLGTNDRDARRLVDELLEETPVPTLPVRNAATRGRLGAVPSA